jgi:hypothetical protein
MFKDKHLDSVIKVFCENILSRIDHSIDYAKHRLPKDLEKLDYVNNRTGEIDESYQALYKLHELRRYVEEYYFEFLLAEHEQTADKKIT